MAEYVSKEELWKWGTCIAKRNDNKELIPKIGIHLLPTVDVAPVIHAKWLGEDEIDSYDSECSNCGKSFLWEDYKGVNDWYYCPCCGAKMENRIKE